MGKKCGIYCIENTIDHKKYIGLSRNIEERWYNHCYHLRAGTHINTYLQNAYNKYGADAFTFYILEQCNEDQLEERERYYIESLETMTNQHGYNIMFGECITTKDKRAVVDYRTQEIYQSIGDASSALHISHPTVVSWCNKHQYVMFYDEWNALTKDEQDAIMAIDWDAINRERRSAAHSKENMSPTTLRKHQEAHRGKKHPRATPVYCPELDEYFWGAKEAYDKYGIGRAGISNCLTGKLKHSGHHPITGQPLTWVKVMKE